MSSASGSRLLVEPTIGLAGFGCSRTGASHISVEGGPPCQDAYLLTTGSVAGAPYVIAAAADGHGDKKHDRSQIGSHLAVVTSVATVLHLFHGFRPGSAAALKASFKADFPRLLVRAWRQSVDVAGDGPGSERPDDAFYSRYGTTLLCAAVIGDAVLLAQLGDGDIGLISEEGTVEIAFGEADGLVGGDTHSLASPEATERMKCAARDLGPTRMITLSTDGLRNSYPDSPKFEEFLRSLDREARKYGLIEVGRIIPDKLDGFSRRGSGDDMTLVAIAALPTPATRGDKVASPDADPPHS